MKNNLGNKETMAKNIKRYMELKGVKATDVCNALDIPKSTFSSWCSGVMYPRIDKIERMAAYFGVTKADLVEEPQDAPISTAEVNMIETFRRSNPEIQATIRRLLAYSEAMNKNGEEE